MIDITMNPPSSDEIEMRDRNDRVMLLAISVIFVVFLATSMFNSSSWIFYILFVVVLVNLCCVRKTA